MTSFVELKFNIRFQDAAAALVMKVLLSTKQNQVDAVVKVLDSDQVKKEYLYHKCFSLKTVANFNLSLEVWNFAWRLVETGLVYLSSLDSVLKYLFTFLQKDLLMKYIYRGFESPSEGSSAQLLFWHEKVFETAGVGSIVRVMTDRKKVWTWSWRNFPFNYDLVFNFYVFRKDIFCSELIAFLEHDLRFYLFKLSFFCP